MHRSARNATSAIRNTRLRVVPPALAVAARAALLEHPAKRSLLWFLQALSLEAGGFKKLAADLVAMFPERLGTATMHRIGMKPGRIFSPRDVRRVEGELADPQRRFRSGGYPPGR